VYPTTPIDLMTFKHSGPFFSRCVPALAFVLFLPPRLGVAKRVNLRNELRTLGPKNFDTHWRRFLDLGDKLWRNW